MNAIIRFRPCKQKLMNNSLEVAAVLVGWRVIWVNQNARIVTNAASIQTLAAQDDNVTSQATEADKAIKRIQTKIEYIIKGIDEIKAEVKGKGK